MNRAASNLADRKLLQGHVKNERLIGKMEQEQGNYLGQKMGWLLQGHFSLGDDRGISGGLPDADQEIPN